MTKRDDIVFINHTELLGPLVLSDLHKTGHSCFPVVAGDLDHIVGMLDIREHLTLEAKRSVTAAKAMMPQVFYIRGDQPLDQALAAFVRTHYHLLVVINEEGETLGLLSLRDVLETLFGRPMADEFASDSDVRLVAGREP
jgi:CBS domain containing-hemolysin-like protein